MELQKKASKESLKEHNTNLVFQTIYNHRTSTRVRVADETDLTRTTVAQVVSELVKKNLVRDIGKAQATLGRTPPLGRTPTLFSVEKDGRYIIAVDISNDTITGALINLRGEIKERRIDKIRKRNEDNIVEQIYEIIDQLKFAANKTDLLGIGLSITGVVNTDTGVLVLSNHLKLKNVRFRDLLEGHYRRDRRDGRDDIPVYVMNDGQALALGEYTLFQGAPITNLIVFRTGMGIGGGLILNGQVFHGDGYGAGELGKIVVADGEDGFLTTVATDAKIIERAQKRASQDPTSKLHGVSPLSLECIRKAALAKDSVALQIIEETGRYFGRAIGYLVNILNVHHIVVSGDIHVLGDALLKAMKDEMEKYCLKVLAAKTKIRIEKEDTDKYLIGAATQILMHKYGIPRFVPDHI